MKITLNIPDGVICAIFNGIEFKDGCYNLFAYSLETADMVDGNTLTLPRQEKENG